MPKVTSSLGGPISFDFVDNAFVKLGKYATVPEANKNDVFKILTICWEYDVTLCNQVAYILATAKHESKFNGASAYDKSEDFSYSKEALLGMKRDKVPLFTPEWIEKNIMFKYSASAKKELVIESDWYKIANRMYANINGNGDEASGDGWKYRGRGYAQLTGKANYERLGDDLGVDLVEDPDAAFDEDLSARILVLGLKNGRFTQQGNLKTYLSKSKEDYLGARNLVNGRGDKADEIAQIAQSYETILLKWKPVYAEADTEKNDVIRFGSSDYIYSGGPDNVLYAGLGGSDYFDGGDGVDWIVFRGTSFDFKFGIPDDLTHPGASIGVRAILRDSYSAIPQLPNVPESLAKNNLLNSSFILNFENLVGSDYSDILVGNRFANVIQGSDGDDLIFGGFSSDTLSGGSGRDIFSYYWWNESTSKSPDTITDFNPKRDKIDLSQIDADNRWFSNESFKFVGKISRSSDLIGGQLGYVISEGNTSVFANINTSSVNGGDPRYDTLCEIRINLEGKLGLSKDCFIL